MQAVTLAQSAIVHEPLRAVPLAGVEEELLALRKPPAGGMPLLRACTMTLAIHCEHKVDPADLHPLISRIVAGHPARIILCAEHEPDAAPWLEARISAYTLREDNLWRMIGEEIALYPRGNQYESLPSAVLALRVSALPFVLYWRGQPDLEDPVLRTLLGECDQILFDSAQFTASAEQVNALIAQLRERFPRVSFGDMNWQRIRPWREFIAQFFDDPANLPYLETINRFVIEYSVGLDGNQSAAMLLMAWLASALHWQAVPGSYERRGSHRFARFTCRDREIPVEINVHNQSDCVPGELTGVRLEASGEPNAVFQVKRSVGGIVDIQDWAGERAMERRATLALPEESAVISSELYAPRRDRNYHRALDILAELVGV